MQPGFLVIYPLRGIFPGKRGCSDRRGTHWEPLRWRAALID